MGMTCFAAGDKQPTRRALGTEASLMGKEASRA